MTGARSSASTVEPFVLSAVVSLVFGTLLAAARVGPVPVLATAGAAYVTLVRNTPLLVAFIFVFVAMPSLELEIDSFLLEGVMALSLYTSAFVCEALHSGINSVPLGQAEASRALGLTFTQSMGLVLSWVATTVQRRFVGEHKMLVTDRA